MGTRISLGYASGESFDLPLSNGAADVLNWTLAVAASRELYEIWQSLEPDGVTWDDLAWESQLATFFVSRDAGRIHISEGFELGRLGWEPETFHSQKQTLATWVQRAIDEMEQEPGQLFPKERLLLNLGALRTMIWNLHPAHLPADTGFEWLGPPPPKEISFCAQHRVLLHEDGCLLCRLLGQ